KYRQEIIDKGIRIFTLPGFEIARGATARPELQLRMQGNAFLGAFFGVSDFLDTYGVTTERFREIVRGQYDKKFGRFGEAVVESNMTVMMEGRARVREVPHGDVDAPDRSSMRSESLEACDTCAVEVPEPVASAEQEVRLPLASVGAFNAEFKAGLGYHQPSSPLASVGVAAAGTGRDASKYVARREVPVWLADKCTQCMDCIVACPDTALPNTAQDIGTVLRTAANGYVKDPAARLTLLGKLDDLESTVRTKMMDATTAKEEITFHDVLSDEVAALDVDETAQSEFMEVFDRVPIAFAKTPSIFRSLERKEEGAGGLFAIMVSDRCKGCGECVVECGEHEALVMVPETEIINADHHSGTNFLDLLPETSTKYLGRFNPDDPKASHAAQLKNHLMVRRNYEALVSGDGACAGCGEKSVLRGVASVTEAYMRPLYHARADRLEEKAGRLAVKGAELLGLMKAEQSESYELLKRSVAHTILGLGGDTAKDTDARLAERGEISDAELVEALVATMRTDAFNHRDLQAIDGTLPNGMSVMAMGAHTGCNSVYGSTPPNIPHPYPWMNSLFQDGVTVSWLMGEGFILDHARRSVIPERLADRILDEGAAPMTDEDYFRLTHMTDAWMTDREIRELPKAWAVGGDGGMGDIGFQNASKVVLQNRPNVKVLLLDTQVYSNTGGQNSDSTPMPGGGDMNQFGAASEGKLTEKKGVAEAFISGHGSPYVAQVSMANVAQFYKAVLEGLDYRGTAFVQSFTTCQPEHGVADDVSTVQAIRARDSRSVPQFVFNPALGETYAESVSLAGNPNPDRDWYQLVSKKSGRKYEYTVAHYATTEARFRRHFKPAKETEGTVPLSEILNVVTQNDVNQRNVFDPEHLSFVPELGVTIEAEDGDGNVRTLLLSRMMVLFCVERRKAWRMLQSRAGITNTDYEAQKKIRAEIEAGGYGPVEARRIAAEKIVEALAATD
ncbi:MAG: thiamine pyrophosphate-dependent enzyme, partial [Actinomycetota bacterium]